MECCVPPGFRFHPTDEELVGYYLNKKVASQKIDLEVIRDIDLYRIEPWDLQERCRIGCEEQTEWYFFSHKDKKYPTGTRTNRATLAGFWKATGRDKAIHDKNKLIGMRKTLVFYKGRAPNGHKTDWIMHEYRLESEENAPPQEEGWVVCRAFKKRATSQPRTLAVDPWDSAYCASMPPLPDPLDFLYRQQQQHFCKQEAEHEALNLLHHSNAFVQLPQLESPSLPPPMRMSSLEDADQEQVRVVTDWRALDKLVASQLSHEEIVSSTGPESELVPVAGFGVNASATDLDIAAMLLLQGEGDQEGRKMEGLLSASSDGICVFEN